MILAFWNPGGLPVPGSRRSCCRDKVARSAVAAQGGLELEGYRGLVWAVLLEAVRAFATGRQEGRS